VSVCVSAQQVKNCRCNLLAVCVMVNPGSG